MNGRGHSRVWIGLVVDVPYREENTLPAVAEAITRLAENQRWEHMVLGVGETSSASSSPPHGSAGGKER